MIRGSGTIIIFQSSGGHCIFRSFDEATCETRRGNHIINKQLSQCIISFFCSLFWWLVWSSFQLNRTSMSFLWALWQNQVREWDYDKQDAGGDGSLVWSNRSLITFCHNALYCGSTDHSSFLTLWIMRFHECNIIPLHFPLQIKQKDALNFISHCARSNSNAT